MKVESVPLKELMLDPSNARKHSEKNLSAIKASLAKFGQQKPIVVGKDNVIIAGNGTYEGAVALGWDKIDVVRSKLTGADAVAYALADNRTTDLSEWDPEVLSKQLQGLYEDDYAIADIGFDPDEYGFDAGSGGGNTDDDEVPKVEENIHGVKRGDIWQLGQHRLMCGDSTSKEDVDRLMGGEKADMVFTDPPYGVSYADKNAFLNTISLANRSEKRIEADHGTVDEMYELWCKVFNMLGDVMAKESSFYVCSPQGGELMMMMMQAIHQSPLSLKHCIIWVKNNHVLGRCDYNYKHEPILYGWLKKGTHKFYGKGECKTSVWPFDKPLKNDLHPTMKPIALVEEAILNSSAVGNLFFEPFCGSGSTLIACEKTGRRCYAVEIDPHYCSVIIERWQQYTGQQATHVSLTDADLS